MRYRFEQEAYKIFNNATSTTIERYKGFDDLALGSTSHLDLDGGTQSNYPSTAVTLSQTAVQNAVKAFHGWKDQRGVMPAPSVPSMAIVSPDYQYLAAKIFKNAMEADTADNNENWVRKGPDGNGVSKYLVSRYLSNSKFWALLSKKGGRGKDGHDLKMYIRVHPQFETGTDFQTGNFMGKTRARLISGFSDWRGVYVSSPS